MQHPSGLRKIPALISRMFLSESVASVFSFEHESEKKIQLEHLMCLFIYDPGIYFLKLKSVFLVFLPVFFLTRS